MTSKTIPTEEERVADYVLRALIDRARLDNKPLSVRALTELQSLRTQPTREAVIEECAAVADLVCKANFMTRGGLLVDKLVARIRALKSPSAKE